MEKHLLELLDGMYNTEHTLNWMNPVKSNYVITELSDGSASLVINVAGHNPSDITIETTDTHLTVKAEAADTASSMVKDIDYSFELGNLFGPKNLEASFDNGLLRIILKVRDRMKPKKVKITE